MKRIALTGPERDALETIFDLAEGYSGGALRARRLLCAWWNGAELGGFDFADLWGLDDRHKRAALAVIALIGRVPDGTYADAFEGFEKRARDLAMRRVEELETARKPARDDDGAGS